MLTKNFDNLSIAQKMGYAGDVSNIPDYSGGSFSVKDVYGDTWDIYGYPQTWLKPTTNATTLLNGNDYTYLMFGTGSSEEQYDDYSLNFINGLSIEDKIVKVYDGQQKRINLSYFVRNNSGQSVRISEIGIVAGVEAGSSQQYKQVLLFRKKLSSQIYLTSSHIAHFDITIILSGVNDNQNVNVNIN